jgi:hypothetical protein
MSAEGGAPQDPAATKIPPPRSHRGPPSLPLSHRQTSIVDDVGARPPFLSLFLSLTDGIRPGEGSGFGRRPSPLLHQSCGGMDPVGTPPLSPVLVREDHTLPASTLVAVAGVPLWPVCARHGGGLVRWRPAPTRWRPAPTRWRPGGVLGSLSPARWWTVAGSGTVVASRRRSLPCVDFFVPFAMRLNSGARERMLDILSRGC